MRPVALVLALCACGTTAPQGPPTGSWALVFENDADGGTVAGSKAALIDAVERGVPVRVMTLGRRITHVADAAFLSIFEGEVFAQLAAIESQRPSVDPPRIGFREPGVRWRVIVGTNGAVSALMDGGEPNDRTGATRWFVPR
ncbi:MAG: hypothetical protein AAFU77_14545 [Myxococcota bacterium]